jgi:energy-coupling factor transporter ATP-binding protein EcfA2
MPFIKSFTVDGLAEHKVIHQPELNEDVNIFYGPNGCGKTSLLRILHSALLQKADILKDISFKSCEVVIHSYSKGDHQYLISKEPSKEARHLRSGLTTRSQQQFEWIVTPEDVLPWIHEYLPIARLYEGAQPTSEMNFFSPPDNSEMGLEARFASNLLNTWKDYTRGLAKRLNEIQEEGLARILERVISRSEPPEKDRYVDSSTAFEAVSTFLARRGVKNVAPSSEEFSRRYSKERQFRDLVRDIEDVEKKIAEASAPMRTLERLLQEMFVGEKELTLKDDSIEVAVSGKQLNLSMLSSGEKQLLKIFVATVSAGASVLIIDEPELSMHVDWQRRLIKSMQILNPQTQLIVATHSPEIMADIPDDKVFAI